MSMILRSFLGSLGASNNNSGAFEDPRSQTCSGREREYYRTNTVGKHEFDETRFARNEVPHSLAYMTG
ncbi:hypothetical protein PISMIDRAFT_677363 [Pisolithus microcarpus 441]|uniref:Uncharacterized protein n=1 Tax=Pisolithus microcarpus 441 TaxID=765257 RepID=A0A0C9YJK4_9AGAM|nr:hypothetical protein PISMIDRAFT_677363 [Pisolithus microcarpus 441]